MESHHQLVSAAGAGAVSETALNASQTEIKRSNGSCVISATPISAPAVSVPPPLDQAAIRRGVAALGEWFHNIDLHGVATAPNHFLGDYPMLKWRHLGPALPERMEGLSVLDIGCNAGFFSIELKRRGAARVLGIDADERYLEQGRYAARVLGVDIEFRRMSVYQLADIKEKFDYVLFMGLFYHLRYPVYALDMIVRLVRQRLVFQTMIRGEEMSAPVKPDYNFWDNSPFRKTGFPCMYFFEKRFAGDPTNWFVPNRAAVEGILRSAGLRLVAHPEAETWICEPVERDQREGEFVFDRELAGTL